MVFLLPAVKGADIAYSESDLKSGPHVDSIEFKALANQDQRVQSLLDGLIDMDYEFFDPVHYPVLSSDPDITVNQSARNGYGMFTFNCAKYPLNITGLRKAFAYALDKVALSEEVFDGYSMPHDSVVPLPMSWCIEDDLAGHYYNAEPDIGNRILDDLGFAIDPESGYRLAPDGSPFSITVEYTGTGFSWMLGSFWIDALESIHVEPDIRNSGFWDYYNRAANHEDFDVIFYALSFDRNDVRWLADEFWSGNLGVYGMNLANFANESFDEWRDQLLTGQTYEDIFEAASNMQRVIHENVPRVVLYENVLLQAYRNDAFAGHIADVFRYTCGPWTMRNIYPSKPIYPGDVNVAMAREPASLNLFSIASSSTPYYLFDELYSSLYDFGPSGEVIRDLASSLLVETHADNPAVPAGHARFTVDMVENATWSDGTRLTAFDVAFTFGFLLESNLTILQPLPSELYGVWAPTSHRVVVELSTESFWGFYDFAFRYVIPCHIFNKVNGLGVEGALNWNPVFDEEAPLVTSGPYLFDEYDSGSHTYTIVTNPLFYYRLIDDGTSTTTTSSSSTTTSNQDEYYWVLVISAMLPSASVTILLYFLAERRTLRRRPD